jgi:hypothetical protein
MQSDFAGLDPDLDTTLDTLAALLHSHDVNGDNRLNISGDDAENGIAASLDANGDGFVDDYDMFLRYADANSDGVVTATELGTSGNTQAAQLLELIDTSGDSSRPGYNDGQIDVLDHYTKIRGEISLLATLADWEAGAAGGNIQNYYRGPVVPGRGAAALTFEATDTDDYQYTPSDFDVSAFRTSATGDLASQATTQAAAYDPGDDTSPQPLGTTAFESVPFDAAHPYDWYDRPVYTNMSFTDVTIPQGTNALFVNCTFIGVTFIETASDNSDADYNYAGIVEVDGSLKYPSRIATVNSVAVPDTRTVSNNIRFDGCTFEGAIVSDVPDAFTHVRNKIAFTGRTRFVIDGSSNLSSAEKELYKRSTIFMPHYSVEMGTFIAAGDANEAVELSGTIVTGLIDMRGRIDVNGTILTTFEPISGQEPVLGNTSPQFNTTLGYFSSATGDLEAELPVSGVGVIHVRYNEDQSLPDGILGPIQIRAVMTTYFEGGGS